TDIVYKLKGVKYFLWHINNLNYRDQLFAKHLLNVIEGQGVRVFPNYNTNWHFDDKVAQKYLFESLDLPLVKSYVFYDRDTAVQWLRTAEFPKVFKLRRGSGSKGVRLAKSHVEAVKLINTAFGSGFKPIDRFFIFKERVRKFKAGSENLLGVFKGGYRALVGSKYTKMSAREKGYVYFQDYIPGNDFDVRIVVVGKRAFGIKRMNRRGDFRASGSGHLIFDHHQIDEACVSLAFEANKKLRMQSAAFDFLFDVDGIPLIVEVSFGYNPKGYRDCEG